MSLAQLTLNLGNNAELRLVLIPSGTFLMGSVDDGEHAHLEHLPTREVVISKPFFMSACQITQRQFEEISGRKPSRYTGAQRPVEQVSFADAIEFCKKLSQKARRVFCLPTEAQWEYACRAGTETTFSFGDSDADLHKNGNYCDLSNTMGLEWQDKLHSDGFDKTSPVGSFKPNDWGLYDMHGNVWEWCSDWFADSFSGAKSTDPSGPPTGNLRVIRGGSFSDAPSRCSSASRSGCYPEQGTANIGFRVVGLP
jgi:formylglycine-generating enzyme required for sulfatase activity